MDAATLAQAAVASRRLLARRGAGLSRFHTKLLTGQNVKITFIGDSGLEGNTATTPGTDDCASLTCSTLASQFGVTVTKSNRAVSGWRAYSALDPSHANPSAFANALADNADLYVISFGHNDLRSGPSLGSQYRPGTGYEITPFKRAVEHLVRRIRIDRPSADILITSEWQYTGASAGSNTDLVTYSKALRQIAALYGCAFADFYGALAALGVTGSNATVDDIYIWPSGGSAQHPKSAGHAVWARTITEQLPANVTPPPEAPVLPGPIFGAERYCHTPWVAMPTATNAVRTYGTSGYRLVGSWASTSTLPQSSSTAGDYAEFQICGHELAMRFDGTGSGHVKIEVDGAVYNADLNLGAQGGGQNFYVLDLGPGIHRVVVTVLSGTVTFRGADYAPTLGNRIPYTSGLLTYTGTWITLGTEAKAFEGNAKQTTTTNDTLTIEWVGTALWCAGSQYGSTTNSRGVNTDGAGEVVTDYGISGGATQYAGWLVASGLPYGRHTTVIRQASAGRALVVSSFLAFDERRHERPNRMRGITVSGESPAFPVALPGRPAIRLSPDDATSAVPPYTSSESASGFTANGTAAARHQYELETGRIAY